MIKTTIFTKRLLIHATVVAAVPLGPFSALVAASNQGLGVDNSSDIQTGQE